MAAKERTYNIPELRDLDAAVEDLLKTIGDRDAVVFLLDGPLGAGKTAFVSALVKALGGEPASSPTFVLHQQYANPHRTVHHFDLYRMEDESELESSGLWDLVAANRDWICIEWASRFGELTFPPRWAVIKVTLEINGSRVLKILQSHL